MAEGATAGGPPAKRPVNVNATISVVLNVCLRRSLEAQNRLRPAKILPAQYAPSFNSGIAAAKRQETEPELLRSKNDSICSLLLILVETKQSTQFSRVLHASQRTRPFYRIG